MSTSIRNLFGAAAVAVAACALGPAGWAQEDAGTVPADVAAASQSQLWPIRFQVEDDAFTVYPLQLERWERDRLEARAAIAVQPAEADRPLFGVVSVSARTAVDQRSGMVTVRDIEARSGSFPTAPEHATGYLDAVRRHLATVTWQVSRDRLQDDLAIDRAAERSRGEPLRNDPPRIVYVDSPAILVPIDGEPVLREMDGLGLRRVLNTRALILQDTSTNRYFLNLAGYWLEAAALDGPWTEAQVRPMTLDEAKRQAEAEGAVDLLEDDQPSSARAPEVIVRTGPTELVQTDGPPQYAPIGRTDLLFVSNSPNRLFLDLRTQRHYVLLAGRWYRTPSLARGPWDYVPGADLPADFALIPDNHPTQGVRVAVPGTPQAQEATIANGVPEFATVKRSAARLEITYDGPPQFRPIEGTRLEAAVNAPVPVIRVDWRTYYALDNGVWFFSDSPDGPWTAAASVPAVVYTIPRSDPLHHVTYVRVYDVTPEEVYIGYTPGYVGSYTTIGGTVVYGSGWYYRPWIGTFWYAPPVTWGFGFSFWYSWWDPWPHGVWWGGWRPVPCFRPAWGPWPHRHVGVGHHKLTHHGVAVIPAKAWPTHAHRRTVVGTRDHDRSAFRANRAGVHDIYRRWDSRDASHSRSGPRPDSRLAGRTTRDRDTMPPSSHRREEQRRPFDRNQRLEDRQWPRTDAPRWVRPADRVNPPDRAAAPRSPGLGGPTRVQPSAPPAAAMPRSPGLRADNPDVAGSRQRQFDRSARPGSPQGMQPEVPRRVFREDAPRPALQDPRPSMPRVHPQQRRQTVDAPSSRPDARREFRQPSQRPILDGSQELRRDRTWSPPAATAPGSNITAPPRQHDWRRDRTRPSAAATAPGSNSTVPPRQHDWRRDRTRPSAAATAPGARVTAPPQGRSEGFMRDSGRGFRNGSGIGARQGRPAAR